jgi:Cys-tRNA(Pro)/Cys-tRNA(Cys) deacylase
MAVTVAMKQYEEKLIQYIKEKGIPAEHLSFTQSCHSVEEAAQAVNASPNDLVKNICLLGPADELVIAIVKGEDKVSTSRVAKAVNVQPMRIATPEEILIKTGFPCGGVPSFGYEATFLIDPRVMEKDVVYSGGGSEFSLTRISVQHLKAANQGEVVRIRK